MDTTTTKDKTGWKAFHRANLKIIMRRHDMGNKEHDPSFGIAPPSEVDAEYSMLRDYPF